MSDRAWMPLYIADYLADTGHLTAAEHGAYMLLIMSYWQNGGLPADERLIARFSRLTPAEWADSRDVIAALFDDGWKHKRIDEELQKASEIIAKRRGAAKARHGGSKPDASAVHVQSKCSDTRVPPSPTPSSDTVVSDAAASMDPRSRLWSEGVATLQAITGKPEGAAKSQIGKWLRDNRDDCAGLLAKIRQAQLDRIGEPISWITAALKPPPDKPRKLTAANIWTQSENHHDEFDLADAGRVVEGIGSRQAYSPAQIGGPAVRRN